MPQFLVAPEDVGRGRFRLAGPEAFHAAKVLRLGPGATLTLFDGKGGRFSGVIEEIGADGAVLGRVEKTLHPDDGRAPARVTLFAALLRAARWDEVLGKATQLGVHAFAPVLTPRTVALLHEGERAKAKQERWSRLVLAAAKQCQRPDLPLVREPVQFRDAIRACRGQGVTLLAWEGLTGARAGETLRPALRDAHARRGVHPLEVNLFIGPEGGFSEDEVELAQAEGAAVFSLGPRVLRAETAASVAVALVQYELGGL